MTLPDARETIQDGGLNITEPASMMALVIGKASAGELNTFTLFSSPAALHTAHGEGPGVLLGDCILADGGSPIAFIRCATSEVQSVGAVVGTFTESGTASAVSHSGTGPTPTVNAASANGDHSFVIDITTGGTLGTMAFTVAVDGGAAGAIQTSAAAPNNTYTVPNTGVIITFPAGTYDGADTNTFTVTGGGGSVTAAAPGGAGTITMDARIRVEILSDGGLGEATFRYNLDGYDGDTEDERTYSEELFVPAGGTFAIPNLGVTLTFADEDFFEGDLYVCDVECAAPNATDLGDALDAAIETEIPWRFVVVATSNQVGSSTSHALLATALQASLESAAGESVYRAGMISTGGDTAAEALAAFDDVTGARILTAYGKCRRATVKPFAGMAFPITPVVDVFAARAAKSLASTDLKRVISGPHTSIVKLFHDERVSPSGLDTIRVSTMRTFRGRRGEKYITQGWLKSAAGSDFTIWPRRIVMDIMCETVHEQLILEIGRGFRTVTAVINAVQYPGVIDPRDRGPLEQRVSQPLISRLLTPLNAEGVPGHVDDLRYKVSRTHNFLSTSTIVGQVSAESLGYVNDADTQLGFVVSLPEEA